jgi:transposase
VGISNDNDSTQPTATPVNGAGGAAKSAEDKVRIVMAAEGLTPDTLGAFLRREGVHEAELEAWRTTVRTAAADAFRGTTTRTGSSRSAERKRIQELERELRRKDKALAEAAALLVLEKKLRRQT